MKLNRNVVRFGLMLLGNIGVPLTSWISIKCHDKAKEKTTKKDKLKCYIPAFISGAATIGCNVGSYRAGSKEIAALTATATYAIANRDKLEEQLKNVVGEEKAEEVKKEVSKEIVKEDYIEPMYEETGFGNLKVCVGFSGRFFKSSHSKVKSAIEAVNNRYLRGDWVSLNDFYRLNGIAEDGFGEDHLWIPPEEIYPRYYEDNPICFDERIIDDGRGGVVLIVDFTNYPTNVKRSA